MPDVARSRVGDDTLQSMMLLIRSIISSVYAVLHKLAIGKLEEASTHKSAKTLTGNVFVTCDLDL